jgi:hypothetical protein
MSKNTLLLADTADTADTASQPTSQRTRKIRRINVFESNGLLSLPIIVVTYLSL